MRLHGRILLRKDLLLALVALCAALGCARKSAVVESGGESPRTGTHGGLVVTLDPEAIRTAGIVVGTAGPRQLEVAIELPGEIKLNAERSVEVRPTYTGRVEALRARLGDSVGRGQPLAIIHSNESLSDYVLSSPLSGTVVSRPVNVGATVDHESVLYTVADLSSVWLDFPVYVQDLGRIRRGQRVHVRTEGGPLGEAAGAIAYVGPLLDVDTRTTYARVVLPNRDGRWQPGRLVTAVVVVDRVNAPVAVPEEAIVRMGSGTAIFRADSSGFELQEVTVGRSDATTTEITSGLESGARIVVRNAFLLKAELEKGEGGDED